MIVPMKKVWLVMLEKERATGLSALREIGLVHLETDLPSGESWDHLREKMDLLSKAANSLSAKTANDAEALSFEEAISVARRFDELESRAKELQRESGIVSSEIERIREWGDFDPALLAELAGTGIALFPGTMDCKRLASGEGRVISLGRAKAKARVVVAGEEFPEGFTKFDLPAKSLSTLESELAAARKELSLISGEMKEMSKHVASMRRAIERLEQDMRFESARLSFASEGPVCFIRGFLPARDEKALMTAATEHGWGLSIDEPAEDDRPPTKVENHPVVRMIAPVFDFLGTVPGYREYEISPWFLMFFCVFFAMIFGDAGYGALMLIAGVAAALKAKLSGGKVPDAIRLLITLSVFTVAWGTLTGAWFSMPASALPRFLAELSVPAISSVLVVGGTVVPNTDTQSIMRNIQVICFVIGAIQLSLAHLKNIARDFPGPQVIGQAGSLGMIAGMFHFVLFLVVDAKQYPPPSYALWLVIGGFALNFVFGSWNGTVLKSFLGGLKNIIPNFLGMVGVFADIVSYIRLWAVGMAGAQLAGIINGLAGGMLKPALIIAAGILILGFGHVLNMVLGVLSVVVHGVRLNMLEFSSHLGMEWSGYRYDPLRVTYKE